MRDPVDTPARRRDRPPRVLLAEASPPLRCWLEAGLARLSPRITTVDDGVDLLYHLAEQGPFDLVVAALRLPMLTGAQVLAMARAAGVGTPFLLLSPVADLRARRLVERTRPAVLVDDPLDGRVLAAAAEQLLRAPARSRERPRWNRSLPLLARLRGTKP